MKADKMSKLIEELVENENVYASQWAIQTGELED